MTLREEIKCSVCDSKMVEEDRKPNSINGEKYEQYLMETADEHGRITITRHQLAKLTGKLHNDHIETTKELMAENCRMERCIAELDSGIEQLRKFVRKKMVTNETKRSD